VVVDRSEGRQRVLVRVAIAVGACVFSTALVLTVPPVHFAYPFFGAAFSLSAFASVSAVSISVLCFYRYRRHADAADVLIAFLFGVTAVLEAVLPIVAQVGGPSSITVAFWGRLTARALVAVGLCVAAWLPAGLRAPRVTTRAMVIAVLVGSATVVATTAARLSALPVVTEGDGARTALVSGLAVRGIRVAGAAMLLLAAFGFVRRAARDDFAGWLAVGAVLLAGARFQDFLYPALRADLVTTADLLRLAGQTVLVIAAIVELAEFWARRASEARAAERKRLAAELHDGLAQELAYLSTLAAMAAADPMNTEHLDRARSAAERALAETRLAIGEYTRAGPVALGPIIEEVGRTVGSRYHCAVVCDADNVVVDARTAHELSRAAREALTNAARHASAERIYCRLERVGGIVRLTVTDDGAGMSSTTIAGGHFGLQIMRNRAERLGGRCSIQSGPRRGTSVAIEVPSR
jgi:signal transduction histidine kinase